MFCPVAAVPYFSLFHPGKVFRDLQALKLCFATMETNFELLKQFTFFFQMSVNRNGEKLPLAVE